MNDCKFCEGKLVDFSESDEFIPMGVINYTNYLCVNCRALCSIRTVTREDTVKDEITYDWFEYNGQELPAEAQKVLWERETIENRNDIKKELNKVIYEFGEILIDRKEEIPSDILLELYTKYFKIINISNEISNIKTKENSDDLIKEFMKSIEIKTTDKG